SVGSPAQVVTPTVRPEVASTVNTRALSPESLTVVTRPPAAVSPLDSTIAGSANRNATSRSASAGARAVPIRKGTASATASASRTPVAHQLGQLRVHGPGLDQVVVVLADAAALDRATGAHRPQQGV